MKVTEKDIAFLLFKRMPEAKLLDCQESVNLLFEILSGVLRKGDEISIKNFGHFRTTHVSTGNMKNVHTGEPLKRKRVKVIRFRPFQSLKESVK